MAQSARLGAWEARLEALATSIRTHTVLMEKEGATRVEKKEVFMYMYTSFTLYPTCSDPLSAFQLILVTLRVDSKAKK